MAEQVSREQDIVDLRLGQRIQVDDGSCPAGQIKEVSGATMTASGILRAQKCIPRLEEMRSNTAGEKTGPQSAIASDTSDVGA